MSHNTRPCNWKYSKSVVVMMDVQILKFVHKSYHYQHMSPDMLCYLQCLDLYPQWNDHGRIDRTILGSILTAVGREKLVHYSACLRATDQEICNSTIVMDLQHFPLECSYLVVLDCTQDNIHDMVAMHG